jgi:Mn2+/Fe2+ NRAMP family transporter
MDPGNWSTCLAAGSGWRYSHLFIVFASTLMAMHLQCLATRLGLGSGHDLAQACRDAYSRPVVIALWISAELAMAATDLAEVIGFAVAFRLLTGLPTAAGVALAVGDTFILLALPSHSGRVRVLEILCAVLVATIFACFAAELALAKPDGAEVMSGFLPTARVVGADGALLVAVGIIGATVMPHNLYLHSSLVRTRRVGVDASADANVDVVSRVEDVGVERGDESAPTTADSVTGSGLQTAPGALSAKAADSAGIENSTQLRSRAGTDDSFGAHSTGEFAAETTGFVRAQINVPCATQAAESSEGKSRSMPSGSIGGDSAEAVAQAISLGIADTILSLSLAFIVNASILIVAGSAFSGPIAKGEMTIEEASSLEGAYRLLAPLVGGAAPVLFGVALLASGQSSTLTGTLAGQVVMEGFVNLRITPWARRLITRAVAIIPAAITIAVSGDAGLDRLLVLSQVVLAFQLPFAVVPLVSFATSKKRVGPHAAGMCGTAFGWLIALIVICVNLYLVSAAGF